MESGQQFRHSSEAFQSMFISIWVLMCGGVVRSMLLLPLVARCLETIDACIWRMLVFMTVVVTV